ncbi:glycoside hydrolase [Bisporella sp. PMI_857]|nr:glycoside hydrolase [Bisporella sp. PMI_857]
MTPTPVVTATSSSPGSTVTRKAVFFHYMVGNITDEHCRQDIVDAKALGADAFALNINTVTQSWATDTVTSLFNWANTLDFKLFFSFDMTGFSHPNQFISYLQSYITNPAHYKYNGLPFVSTFNGGAAQYNFGQASVNDGWKVQLQQVMANTGHPIYFVPAFQDVPITSSFYSTFPTLNGAMNWDAWPQDTQGNIIVPINLDQTLQIAGKSAGKTFLMGVSPVQFKHIDGESNWYRRGEQNLEYRIGQVLSLQPDFIEIQSWNDAGESHYMGNSWLEPISGTPIVDYTQAYDHTAYKEILPAFIKAFKDGVTTTAILYPTNGAAAQGTFWHHTLLAAGTCPSDPLGLPRGASTVENKVTAVVLVAAGQTGLQAILTSGSTRLGTQNLVAGFNGFSFGGMTTGSVSVRVINSVGTTLVSGTGPIAVVSTATLCNYNFQVVGLH